MSQLLRARRVLTEQGWLDDHQLRIENGVITAIEPVPAGLTPAMPGSFVRRTSIFTFMVAWVWM